MPATIDIQNASGLDQLPDEDHIIKWVSQALDDQHQEAEISLRIVDEEEACKLNKMWRKKDYATNVLSFPIDKPIEQAPNLLGDIVVCAPKVISEAAEQGKEINAHWAHLIIHGILHLQGYDHEQDEDATVMESKEIQILANIGYPNPYETELRT